MRVALLVAMDKEYTLVKDLLTEVQDCPLFHCDAVVGKSGDKSIMLCKCGIGKVNSALGTQEMIRAFLPDIVVSSGCAGSLSESLCFGDVCVGLSYTYHDVWCGSGNVVGQVQGLPAKYAIGDKILDSIRSIGKYCHFVSGDRFVDSEEVKGDIKKRFPECSVVDMESCSIAQTCHIYEVPFVSIRVISDCCSTEEYDDFWGTLAMRSFEFVKRVISLL